MNKRQPEITREYTKNGNRMRGWKDQILKCSKRHPRESRDFPEKKKKRKKICIFPMKDVGDQV